MYRFRSGQCVVAAENNVSFQSMTKTTSIGRRPSSQHGARPTRTDAPIFGRPHLGIPDKDYMKRLDPDGDGKIEGDDFKAEIMATADDLQERLQEKYGSVGEAMKKWDTDGDGKISKEEFMKGAKELGTMNFIINWSTSEFNTQLNPPTIAWVTQIVGSNKSLQQPTCIFPSTCKWGRSPLCHYQS